MPKRIVYLCITVCCILSFLSTLSPPAFAEDWQDLSSDLDGDGLLNDLETTGWYNEAGGPFVTDSLDADSDDDGLTDGEEKLFDTDPLDEEDPGIHIRYQQGFLTKQYFSTSDPAYLSMRQAGDRHLMTEAMVLRRGTTFLVGGPISATLTTTSDSLTTLPTPEKDPASGGWIVTIPSNAKTGTYTATLSLGGWSESMPLYVIFELPTPSPSSNSIYNLTQEHIDAFAYDDDPSNLKDETAVWFLTPEWSYYWTCDEHDAPCSDEEYTITKGHAQVFWTDQFKQYVLLDHTMPAIEGQSSLSSAVDAIAYWADWEFRTNYSAMQQSFSSAMYRWDDGTGITMWGGGCESNSGVFSTLLRSAGIVARPFLEDYNKTPGHGEGGQFDNPYQYDHSVMMWINDHWRGARSFAGDTGGQYYPWDDGFRPHKELYQYYYDQASDLIITANEGWDFSSDGGMVNDTVLPGYQEQEWEYSHTWDYRWHKIRPLEIERSPYVDVMSYEFWHGDTWAPVEWYTSDPDYPPTTTYSLPEGVPAYPGDLENWPDPPVTWTHSFAYYPIPTGCSPTTTLTACVNLLAIWEDAGGGGGGTQASALQQATLDAALRTNATPKVFLPLIANSSPAQANPVELDRIVSDHGVDTDGNGRFDELIVEFLVRVAQPGTYQFGGWMQAGRQAVRADERFYLTKGRHILQVSFDGEAIGRQETDGPYQVVELWAAEPDQPLPKEVFPDEVLDHLYLDYATASYAAHEFEAPGALLSGDFSHQGVDDDGDGYTESVVIDIGLRLNYPGRYRATGDLYDDQGNFVGHAAWSGSGATASLVFGIERTSPPYTLSHVQLFDARGALLDSRHQNAHTIAGLDERVDQGPITVDYQIPQPGPDAIRPMGEHITPTQVLDDRGVDLDADGLYDQLVIDVEVQVTQANHYRVEGWLQDHHGSLVVYGISEPISLSVGSQMTLSLPFDGRAINGHGVVTGTYTVVALRILDGNENYDVLDALNTTGLELDYSAEYFEPASLVDTVFSDDMESGSANWTWNDPPWTYNNPSWPWSTANWKAASSTYTGTLQLAPLDLSDYNTPVLRFNTTFDLSSPGDVGYVEASDDGLSWTQVATYTNALDRGAAEFVELSDYGKTPSLHLRFNADTQSGLLWYVDDVYVYAESLLASVSFIHRPQPALAGETTTFVASYSFLTPTLPVTLTWDFGDGSPIQVTHAATTTHQYPQALDYTAIVTAENGYHTATREKTVDVHTLLNVNVVGNGTVSRNPDRATYRYGDVVELTADPSLGWSFDNWSGDLTGSAITDVVTIEGNTTVTATFTRDEYTLTVNTVGGGDVTIDPLQATYYYGDEVELTADPSIGWIFDGWSGDMAGSESTQSTVMIGNQIITATFTPIEYVLTVDVVGEGSVIQTPDQSTYHYGDVVTLTAAPVAGWSLTQWSGDLSGGTSPQLLTITGNHSVTATFERDEYTLTVDVVGQGIVTEIPDQDIYYYGDMVTLTTEAETGWTLSQWSGDLSGSDDPANLIIQGNTTITATFALIGYDLDIDVIGNGNVAKTPDQPIYHYGDVVTLTATPEAGWSLVTWSGDLSGGANPQSLTITGNHNVTTTFEQDEYTLAVHVVGQGSVTRIPDQPTYHYGDVVTLTATPDANWYFGNWSGGLSGRASPAVITMVGSRTITATFDQDEYTLSTHVVGQGALTWTPVQPTYQYGDVVTLTAAPVTGWSLVTWSGDLSGGTNPQSLTITGNHNVTATFEQDEYTLAAHTVGQGDVTRMPDQPSYHYGDVVTLTATPDVDHRFAGWAGDLSGDDNPATLVMDGHKHVTATFAAVHPVTDAAFTIMPDAPVERAAVTFTVSITPVHATQPVTYTWDFDDGDDEVVTTMPQVTRVFGRPGKYTVSLTVTNGYGSPCIHSAEIDVTAQGGDPDRMLFLPLIVRGSAGSADPTERARIPR